MIERIYFVQKESFQTAGNVSSEIKKLLKEVGVNGDILRRVAVASYEAEINMVIHSEGGRVILYLDEEWITLIFKDDGPGIKDIEKAMEPGYSTASKQAREFGFGAGMGLFNIKRVADEFSLESNEKTTLTVRFKVNV